MRTVSPAPQKIADISRLTMLIATMEHPAETFGVYGNHAEIRYENVRVPADALIGGEGEGFLIAQHRLGPGRIHHAMRAIGMAERALEMLCRRTAERSTFGRPIIDHACFEDDTRDMPNLAGEFRADAKACRFRELGDDLLYFFYVKIAR